MCFIGWILFLCHLEHARICGLFYLIEIVFLPGATNSKLQFSAAAAKVSLVDSSVQKFQCKLPGMDEKCKSVTI